jgi:hypothetical protein
MDVKVADAKALEAKAAVAAVLPEAVLTEVAQPASKELVDKAPSGNIGALAKNLSARRRENCDKSERDDIVIVPKVG